MKATEAAALLTIAAAYDNRKPDADQAHAWALALDGMRFEDCQQAIVAHYRKSRDWLMPVEVINGVTRIREERMRAFTGTMTPPAHLDDDPRAAIEWARDRKRRIMDGEQVEDEPAAELKPRDLGELGGGDA